MQVVILAGGLKSAISGEQEGIPKPMAELGGRPLLWHIMKHFSAYGMNEFIVCGGYKIEMIKDYFMDFYIYESDITVDLQNNTVQIHKKKTEDWKVTVVDTGINTRTGERVLAIEKYIHDDSFIVTYGDCISDIHISSVLEKHKQQGKIATAVMAKPTGRNQLFQIDEEGNVLTKNTGHEQENNAWINANCYVLNKEVFGYLRDNMDIEQQLLMTLSKEQQISVYKHDGYWRAIETKRDLVEAESLWDMGEAPWKR